jgi:hypothetical protein
VPLVEQRRVGERLGRAPVEGLAGGELLVAVLEDGQHLGVHLEAGGDLHELLGEREQPLPRDARGHLGGVWLVGAAAVARPDAAHPVLARDAALLLHLAERLLEAPSDVA